MNLLKFGGWRDSFGDFVTKYDAAGTALPPASNFGRFMASPVTQGAALFAGTAIPVGLGIKNFVDTRKQQDIEHQLNVHKKMLDVISSAHRAQLMRSIAPDLRTPHAQAAVMSSEPAGEEQQSMMPKSAALLGGLGKAVETAAPHIGAVANTLMGVSFAKDILSSRPPPPPMPRPMQPMMAPPPEQKLSFLAPLIAGAGRMLAGAAPRLLSGASTAANVASAAGAAESLMPHGTPKPMAPATPGMPKLSMAVSVMPPSIPHSGPGITKAPTKPISGTPRGTPGAAGAFAPTDSTPKTAKRAGMVADLATGAANEASGRVGKLLTSKRDMLPSSIIRGNDRPLSDIR